jgi:hypothetical protein
MNIHSQHEYNADTGRAECECCCGWALDVDVLKRDHAAAMRELEKAKEDLKAQLAALRWTLITPENLPKVGDEVACFHVNGIAKTDILVVQMQVPFENFTDLGYTHRRPINPPKDTNQERVYRGPGYLEQTGYINPPPEESNG